MRPDGVSGVLDDQQSVMARDRPDALHVTRQTTEVYRHYRARPLRNAFDDGIRIDVPIGADIGQHRRRADVENRVDR